jgi:GntR family transcriptional repressor for pyruvate dehydrogenase complex
VDLERIDAAYAALEQAYDSDDITTCIDTDVAFHLAIADASHNTMIGHLAASLMRVIHGHVSDNLVHLHALPKQWGQLRAQHKAIWESVRGQASEDAMRASREHINFVRQSMVEAAKVEDRRNSALRRLS